MPSKRTRQQADSAGQGFSSPAPKLGYSDKYRATAAAREALYRAVCEIDSKNKKRSKSVEKLRYLIYELQSLQPTDVLTLSQSLGQCENTTRSQLRKLMKLDLVIATSFEFHTLYCINGDFNIFINDILERFFNED